jgi:hypothetical protein
LFTADFIQFSDMGKDKKTEKSILMPSTTQEGKNFPTSQLFSPDATTTTVPKVSSTVIPCSPLSRSSLDDDMTLLDMDIATDGSCDLSWLIECAMVHQHGTSTPPSTSSPLMLMIYLLLMPL